ncbi:unnamed protein product [Chondrus crispus]|uniref:Cyclic nucleotide-binding domain-containing protein n=1 Tax=Chondrus crispus TaxID=2769 RepID=R7QK72_CHOCR|nr:unnamed protein product [Chondrus crispus]CDF38922.1 unnamed protein product [Chondrus crispus]|eukprot:XP_005718827.1 unnamed protein product [Chondrus crispus]
MFAVLVYLATVSVFVFSFLGSRGPASAWFWVERAIDCSFAADLVLNFFTAYERAGLLVTDRRDIRAHYLATWFVPDVVTTFPWDLLGVSQRGNDPSQHNLLKLPRFIRLIRLFKLVRLTKIIRLKKRMTRLEIKLRLKYGHVKLVGLFISVVFSMHLFACLFYYVASLDGFDGSWVAQDGIPSDLYGRYIAALYFSVYTITTIGYGDVVPENTRERSFTTVFMFLGAAMFAYIISQVSNIAGELTESSAHHRRMMDSFTDFATYRDLPDDLVVNIRTYFQSEHRRQRVINEQQLLQRINRELRIKVIKFMFGTSVEHSRFFRSIPKDHLDDVYNTLVEKFADKGGRIYSEGDEPSFFYIIIHGSVQIQARGAPPVNLGKDDIFGERDLLFNRTRQSRAISTSSTGLVQVPRRAVMRILQRHPRALKRLRDEEALMLWNNVINVSEEQIQYQRFAHDLRENAVAFIRQNGPNVVRQQPPVRRISRQASSQEWRAMPGASQGSFGASGYSLTDTGDEQENSSQDSQDGMDLTTRAMKTELQRKTLQVSELEAGLRDLQRQLDLILRSTLL